MLVVKAIYRLDNTVRLCFKHYQKMHKTEILLNIRSHGCLNSQEIIDKHYPRKTLFDDK
jgi:hypothetical protein